MFRRRILEDSEEEDMEEKDLLNDIKYVKNKLEDVKLKDQIKIIQLNKDIYSKELPIIQDNDYLETSFNSSNIKYPEEMIPTEKENPKDPENPRAIFSPKSLTTHLPSSKTINGKERNFGSNKSSY
jgi:hypothetical protein